MFSFAGCELKAPSQFCSKTRVIFLLWQSIYSSILRGNKGQACARKRRLWAKLHL